MSAVAAKERWLFLGVLIDVLTEPGAPVTVAEAVLPEGASPPAHVHDGLDDSFYVLAGHLVVQCGDQVSRADPGSWVQFPAGVPHSFRVLGGPATVLMVHADDSFLGVVRDVGRPATEADAPDVAAGPSIEQLDRAFAAHGIVNVGVPIEQAAAELLLDQAASAAAG